MTNEATKPGNSSTLVHAGASRAGMRQAAMRRALLSAFAAVGRVWVGPLAGVLAESIGWPSFFILSTFMAAPALAMLWWLREPVRALEVDPDARPGDDE